MVKPSATGSPKISSKNLGVAGASSKIKKSVAENDSPSKPGPATPVKDEASKNLRIKAIRKDIAAAKEEQVDVDLEKLTEHITQLLELIERGKHEELKQSTHTEWPWPKGLKNLEHILSGEKKDDGDDGKYNGGDGKDDGKWHWLEAITKDIKKDFKNTVHKLFGKKKYDGKEDGKDDGKEDGDDGKKLKILAAIISGPVKNVLKGIGHAHYATSGLLVVVYCLERYQELSQNKKKCLKLLKEMCYLAGLVKVLKESRKGLVNVIEDATSLVVEGAILCCSQIKNSPWKGFFNSKENKDNLTEVTEKLDRMYLKINVQMGFRKSPLWKRRPKHADGIEDSTKEVMTLLECDSGQKAVTVILHGFKGRGKTTLAEAVFSEVKVESYKYSKVRLFKDINSTRDIIEFQKAILQDLMEPEETLPDIRTHEDGQDALEEKLEKVEALIYIDNVLKSSELQLLLPKKVDNAKRVRFLITAPEIKDLKYACPRLPLPRDHHVKGIEQPKDVMSILKKEIKDDINESQLKEIIEICGGVPPMLTLVAAFIGRAKDKQKAYNKLKQEKDKCGIPDNCKDPDPFLDIIRSFFKDEEDVKVNLREEEVRSLI